MSQDTLAEKIVSDDLFSASHQDNNDYLKKIKSQDLGASTCTKFDEFSENFRMGGGVISDPKNFFAVFSKILGR